MFFSRLARNRAWRGWGTATSLSGLAFAGHYLGYRNAIRLDDDENSRRSDGSPHLPESRAFIRPPSSIQKGKPIEYFASKISPDVGTYLRKYEESYSPGVGGISRVDVVQFTCSEPTEDDFATMIVPTPSGFWSFFALFDGHSGWETSAWLRENLIPALLGSLVDLYSELSPVPLSDSISSTIKDTFITLDDDICNLPLKHIFSSQSKAFATNLLAPAYAGSCALLSFYDSSSHFLYTALTGDLRAVLGRISSDDSSKYTALVLTEDQNGDNPSEVSRLQGLHPGETIVKNGRVLGMGPSRAFGDARYKWNLESAQRLKKEKYMGRTPIPAVKTPPYLTAEPEVGCTAIVTGDFLIMATDGLWECLTSEEAVGLVGLWNEQRKGLMKGDVISREKLPMAESIREDNSVRWRQWGLEAKRFVCKDGENAATHLLRNALGGAEEDVTRALLSMCPPRKRTYM